MRKRFLPASALAILCISQQAVAAAWTIDPAHSVAAFTIKHMTVTTVPGAFGKVTGTIEWDEADITKSKVDATIDATTVNTRNEQRDTHLKSPDFFDVAKFPTITFKSTKVEKAGDRLKVTGDLVMRGVTKAVVLDVEGPVAPVGDARGNTKSGLSATTKINRQDFGITWGSSLPGGGLVLGNDVTITIDLEIAKAK